LGHSKRNGGGKKRRGHNLKRDKTMWGGVPWEWGGHKTKKKGRVVKVVYEILVLFCMRSF